MLDRETGCLVGLQDKVSGATYALAGDDFEIETKAGMLKRSAAKLVSLKIDPSQATAVYRLQDQDVTVSYAVPGHFVEKRVTLTFPAASELRQFVLGCPAVISPEIHFTAYRYPKFERKPGDEPSCTFFGRTPQGGLMVGVGMPYDRSTLTNDFIELAYTPSLRLRAGEEYISEPAYFGIYQRRAADAEEPGLPLSSESDAMVRMTSIALGPRRHGLGPMTCGWHSEMNMAPSRRMDEVEADMRSLDFIAECGIDWSSDSHPWGGDIGQLNAWSMTRRRSRPFNRAVCWSMPKRWESRS